MANQPEPLINDAAPTVLVVDDERSNRRIFEVFLSAEGYHVLTAEDAAEALQILDEHGAVDVVISDIVLPKVTGIRLLQIIRDIYPRVEVIIITGEPAVQTAAEAVRAGAFDYLAKPLTKPVILRAVSGAVRMKKMADERDRLDVENQRYRDHLEELVEERTRKLRIEEERRKALEAHIRHVHKMQAVQRLAAGLAHEYSNLITVIAGNAQMAREQIPEDTDIHTHLREVATAAKRAGDLTRNLVTLSMQQTMQRDVLDLNTVIRDLSDTLHAVLGEENELLLDLCPEPCPVYIDIGQMEQVILELVTNARDAMTGGGHLTLRTRQNPPEQDAPPSVILYVSDDGPGMDAHTREHACEPFFTTKADRGNAGLGLSHAYSIVRQMNGHMTIADTDAAGTTIAISMPLADADDMAEHGRAEATAVDGAGLTVLIAEDDRAVRRTEARVLMTMGFNVLEASNGHHALTVAEQHAGPIHVLFSDVVMPDMSGLELRDLLQKHYPDMRSVLVSGHASDRLAPYNLRALGVRFVPKPMGRSEIAQAMTNVLPV